MAIALILYDRAYNSLVHAQDELELSNVIENEILPYICEKISKIDLLTETFIYCRESEWVNASINKEKVKFIKRPSSIDLNSSIETILATFFSLNDHDDVVLVLNPFFPFISKSTIVSMLNSVVISDFESAIGVLKGGLFWNGGKPLNFSLDKPTVAFESQSGQVDLGSVYVFKSPNLKKDQCRISLPVKFFQLSALELLSLRKVEDWDLVQLVLSSGLDKRY